ncbi:MAG: hypothetical protein KCHDKBKB_02040 [Elusimicrobia bacterium]|nr:hypothetical protein [Elusimicrobiota bacterium]
MRKYSLLIFLALAVSRPLWAERRGDQGVGLMLGNPSGFSYKMWLDERMAIDGAAGVDQGEFDLHATLLFHNFTWAKNVKDSLIKGITDNGDFPFYFGVGPRALFDDKTEVGVRFPVGLAFLPHKTTWEFFAEFAPVLRLTPSTGFDADYAIGLRYYFPAVRARTQG